MRRARLTYQGAYHHVMNRGIGGEKIFPVEEDKAKLIKILQEQSANQRISLLGYCVMDDHYHLILQNSSGELSNFIKRVNGAYGIYYRSAYGGKGYVFQSRYHSTLIQDDRYLRQAIIYLLLNPVRAGIADSAYKYRWSSIKAYFNPKESFINKDQIKQLFINKDRLRKALSEWGDREIKVKPTRVGEIIGNKKFIKRAYRLFNRRGDAAGTKRGMRKRDYIFLQPEKVIEKFELENGIEIGNLKGETLSNKRLRTELLVALKDEAGLKYIEIGKYGPFKGLQYSTLGVTYNRYKKAQK